MISVFRRSVRGPDSSPRSRLSTSRFTDVSTYLSMLSLSRSPRVTVSRARGSPRAPAAPAAVIDMFPTSNLSPTTRSIVYRAIHNALDPHSRPHRPSSVEPPVRSDRPVTPHDSMCTSNHTYTNLTVHGRCSRSTCSRAACLLLLAICVLTTLRDLQRAAGEESRLAPLAVMAADVVRHQRPLSKSAWSVFTR